MIKNAPMQIREEKIGNIRENFGCDVGLFGRDFPVKMHSRAD
jgi:hypothetical protein